MSFKKHSMLFHAIIIFVIIIVGIFSYLSFAHKDEVIDTQSKTSWKDLEVNKKTRTSIENFPEMTIKKKLEQVNEDLRLIMRALFVYQIQKSHYPYPDWVLSLPDKELISLITIYFPNLRNMKSKEQILEYEREVFKQHIFLREFKVFTHPYEFCPEEEKIRILKNLENSRYPDFYKPLEGHVIDPFDIQHRVYGFTFDFKQLNYLLVSSGPDGNRDIAIKKFDMQCPNYGYDKPLITYSYDPTNGLISDGDLFLIESKIRSWGIYNRFFINLYDEYHFWD